MVAEPCVSISNNLLNGNLNKLLSGNQMQHGHMDLYTDVCIPLVKLNASYT